MSNYKSSSADPSALFALIVVCVCIGAFVGWVMNIVKLVGLLNGDLTLMAICRLVGVFAAPLGAILGFL